MASNILLLNKPIPKFTLKKAKSYARKISAMSFLYLWCFFVFCISSSDAKTYNLKVRTSKWPGSGTGENVRITLRGTSGKTVSQVYDGWGLGTFEFGSIDDLTMTGEDIGSIVNVQAQILKTGKYLDNWRLFWIKVFADGDVYKGIFEYWFKHDKERTDAKQFEIVRCREGYQPVDNAGMKTCLDRNECLVTCQEANQNCTNLPGTYKCQCKAGFFLDGAVCTDYDECALHSRDPCSFSHAYCVNLPGSYECRCKQGYEGEYHSCQDRDECKLGLHDCHQNCINTPGSYKCGCKPGFKLAVDGKTCLNVDECKGANTCNKTTSVCYDEYGSHRCVCKIGYKEHADGLKKTCIPVECAPLQSYEKNVILSPSRCKYGKNVLDDECLVECARGYELEKGSAKRLRCMAVGFINIDGNMPRCKPKPCGKLTPPNFGYTVPSSCSSAGTSQGKECYIYCDQGFILAGERSYKCDLQKYDKDPSKALCTKIPRIQCPDSITINLPENKERVALGNNFPFFKTNVRSDQVTSNIEGLGPSYEFPLGLTVVKYTATNELNQTDSCSFVVRTVDKTPPAVQFCPSSFTVVSKGGTPVNVSWEQPRFKDNVKIYKISTGSKNGELRSPTSFIVSYRAYDTSGNIASCQFNVNFHVLRCDFDSVPGGDQLIQKSCINMGASYLCMAQCLPTKTFNVINSNHPMFSFMWNCHNADFGINRLPDCVDFKTKDEKSCPLGYTEVKNYRTMQQVCAKCARGTYYKSGACNDCPKNTYQSNEGSLSCDKCKTGFGTSTTRNIQASDCKSLCPRGYASHDGLSDGKGSCKMCPKDTFSDEHGSNSCQRCPNGTATDGEGRTTISACRYAPKNVKMVPAGVIEVSVGDQVQFDCFAEANPLPFVHIRRQKSDANPLTHSLLPVGTSLPNTRGLRYHISKTSIYDSGVYACKAENGKGIVYKKVELVVTEGSGMAPVG